MSLAPIFALHGFTGSPRSFEPLRWTELTAPYLSGHGSIPSPAIGCFDAEVTRIADVIRNEYKGSPVHLMGYSLGSRVALGLVLRHPELFLGATLLSVNPGLESTEARSTRLLWESHWIDLLMNRGIDAFVESWGQLPLFSTQRKLSAETLRTQDRVRRTHTAEGLANVMRTLGLGAMPNFWPELSSLKRPISLIVGSKDEKFAKIAEKMGRLSSKIAVNTLENVGHNPLLEASQEVRKIAQSDQLRFRKPS